MNRQSRNNFVRNQCSQINTKTNIKSEKNESVDNHRKQTNNERLSKSSLTLNSASKNQKKTTINNGNNSKNVQKNFQITSCINLKSCEPKEEIECRIPTKIVYSLNDIQRKDFQFDFPKKNINKENSIKTTSKLVTNLNHIPKIHINSKENKTINFINENIVKCNLLTKENNENISEKIKYLEENVFNEKDFEKKRKKILNFLKKIREDNKTKNERERFENNKVFFCNIGANNNRMMVPLTAELLQSLKLQKSDISLLLKMFENKVINKEQNNSKPLIKFSNEPFVKLTKPNVINKLSSDKKAAGSNLDSRRSDFGIKFNMNNTNVIKESDCFMSKLEGHFIDRSVYKKERKPFVTTPTLSTIIEESEPFLHSA